jgi:threonine/homoserine/homoserine lactone efflux protein
MVFSIEELSFWFTIILVCTLGAMSPGPSLAVVVKHSITTGRKAGYYAAISHGLGIGLYALATALGLSILIQQNQVLFNLVQAMGCLFLLHLSFKLIRSFSTDQEIVADATTMSSHWHAIRDGFLIAVINPKILIFFTALFSQFVRVDSGIGEKLGLALVAGVVDILWYLCVATVVVSSISTRRFIGGGRWMDLLFGLILAAVALRFLVQIGSSYFHW